MKASFVFILLLAGSTVGFLNCGNNSRPGHKSTTGETSTAQLEVRLETIATGLHSPVVAVFDDKERMLVCEQTGTVRLIKNGKLSPDPYLDLRSKMVKISGAYDERGLLGIALHPQYKNNGKFYVYYSAPSANSSSNHKSVIAEFKASPNADKANLSSQRVILTVEQPESNHNGGDMHFGPDGYLYIALGDGGGGGDKHGTIGNGQNLKTLLGKILRIDIDHGATYTVPADNPFKGTANRPEIWAYGLRNPWRFSFDKNSGALYAADVGQNTYEEINIIEKGGNYGWRIMEGLHCFNPSVNCNTRGLKLPIFEYDHNTGISITGGFVYHGKSLPSLSGKYIFADWTGPLFFIHKSGNGWENGTISIRNKPDGDLRILSFAEDTQGELYILTNQETGPRNTKGAIYKLTKP